MSFRLANEIVKLYKIIEHGKTALKRLRRFENKKARKTFSIFFFRLVL